MCAAADMRRTPNGGAHWPRPTESRYFCAGIKNGRGRTPPLRILRKTLRRADRVVRPYEMVLWGSVAAIPLARPKMTAAHS